MSMCDRCIHGEVCGLEDNHEGALIYCKNMIPIDVFDKIRAEIDAQREKLKIMADDDWYAGKIRGYDCAVEIIDKYNASPTGAEGSKE